MSLFQKSDENNTALSIAKNIFSGISLFFGILIILNTSFKKELEFKAWFNTYFQKNPTSQLYITFISKYNTGTAKENYYHERTLLVHDIISLLFCVWGFLIFLSKEVSKQIAEFLSNGFRESVVSDVPEDLGITNDDHIDQEKSVSISHSYSTPKHPHEEVNPPSLEIRTDKKDQQSEKPPPSPKEEPELHPEPEDTVESESKSKSKAESPAKTVSISPRTPEKTDQKVQPKTKRDEPKLPSKSQPIKPKSKLKVKKDIYNKTSNGKSPLGFDMSSSGSSDGLGLKFDDSSILDAINESSDSFDALIRDSSPRNEKKYNYSAQRPKTARRRGLGIDNGGSSLFGSDDSFMANKPPSRTRARTKVSPTKTYDSMNEDSLFNHIVNEDY